MTQLFGRLEVAGFQIFFLAEVLIILGHGWDVNTRQKKWLGEKLKQSGFLELLSILRKVSAKRKVCLGTIMF